MYKYILISSELGSLLTLPVLYL